MTGPRLLLAIALAIATMCGWIVHDSDGGFVDTAATVVRWTARTSLVLFALGYVARPATQLWPNRNTKALLAEGKWIGLGFATSHAAHLALLRRIIAGCDRRDADASTRTSDARSSWAASPLLAALRACALPPAPPARRFVSRRLVSLDADPAQ